MTGRIFDMELRALRRDRAARLGPELFLHERVFEDCLDRLGMVKRSFRSALLVGCPDPSWAERLSAVCPHVDVVDPGALFAKRSGGRVVVEDSWSPEPGTYDLCLAIGTLDTVNDLPRALLTLRFALAPDGLLIGALAGGETLPKLRGAMRAADDAVNVASPHVHPRVEPAAFAGLLGGAGFAMPVVDVDRVRVTYPNILKLVHDLRRMAVSNILDQRSRTPLNRAALAAASAAFAEAGDGNATEESFEIVHFSGWVPAG
jgi:hypothetical protein